MAEKPYTGLTAKIKIGTGETAKVLGYISGFDLSLEQDIIEILSFGDKYKGKVPSIKDWSASCDGTFAMNEGSTQEELYTAYDADTPVTVGTYLDDTTYFEGSAYVQSLSISAAPDDKTSISAEFAGNGAITRSVGEPIEEGEA